jgi:hypothetical protein
VALVLVTGLFLKMDFAGIVFPAGAAQEQWRIQSPVLQKRGAWPSRPCGDWSTFSHPSHRNKKAYLGSRANLHTDLQMNRIRNISVFAQYFRQIILHCWIHFWKTFPKRCWDEKWARLRGRSKKFFHLNSFQIKCKYFIAIIINFIISDFLRRGDQFHAHEAGQSSHRRLAALQAEPDAKTSSSSGKK